MIKNQILILFLCIVGVVWIAYTVRERRKSRENQEEDNDTNHDDNL